MHLISRKKKGFDVLAYTRDDTIPFPREVDFSRVADGGVIHTFGNIKTGKRTHDLGDPSRVISPPPRDLTRDGQDLDYTPKEQPGYRKYRTVDLPTRSKARELTSISPSRRLPRPPLLTPEKAFAKSLASSCISHIRASQLKLKIHNTICQE